MRMFENGKTTAVRNAVTPIERSRVINIPPPQHENTASNASFMESHDVARLPLHSGQFKYLYR